VLILDEPTAALGVRQSVNVLKLIAGAAKGISVIFITHNVNHAYPVGDTSRCSTAAARSDVREGDVAKDACST
jgi:ABC-type sugar transport system ATPase subunit